MMMLTLSVLLLVGWLQDLSVLQEQTMMMLMLSVLLLVGVGLALQRDTNPA